MPSFAALLRQPMVRGLVRGLAVAGLLVRSAGCASRPVEVPPPASPPVAVVPAAPAVTPAVTVAPNDPLAVMLIVPRLPPPPRAEIPGERPDPSRVWVAGYWAWRGDDYEWVDGSWEIPPAAAATWVPPCWVREGDGYRCFTGHWR